jgi:hypothetical protein
MHMRPLLAAALPLLVMATVPDAQAQTGAPGAWRNLIDARATGWRGYQKKELPAGWKVENGALTRVATGGDIVFSEEFGDFELEFEWKVQRKGNSGVFYRAGEATARIYENAAEYQVLDNIEHPDNKTDLTVAGANYALYPAVRDAVKPVGEWNTARIIARGAHVEHWLNGRKMIESELWSPDWEARVKASKFVEWPTYGRAKSGLIGLQDHGDWVAFRNMRIRSLK